MLLSITSESMSTEYWLTTYSRLPRKKVLFNRGIDRPDMTIAAVDWDVKQQTQQNQNPACLTLA